MEVWGGTWGGARAHQERGGARAEAGGAALDLSLEVPLAVAGSHHEPIELEEVSQLDVKLRPQPAKRRCSRGAPAQRTSMRQRASQSQQQSTCKQARVNFKGSTEKSA